MEKDKKYTILGTIGKYTYIRYSRKIIEEDLNMVEYGIAYDYNEEQCEYSYFIEHRTDGPAVFFEKDGEIIEDEEYWYNGILLTKDEWFAKLSKKQQIDFMFGIKTYTNESD